MIRTCFDVWRSTSSDYLLTYLLTQRHPFNDLFIVCMLAVYCAYESGEDGLLGIRVCLCLSQSVCVSTFICLSVYHVSVCGLCVSVCVLAGST